MAYVMTVLDCGIKAYEMYVNAKFEDDKEKALAFAEKAAEYAHKAWDYTDKCYDEADRVACRASAKQATADALKALQIASDK
jgi:hypothetical protein